jgi:hypothetical protein
MLADGRTFQAGAGDFVFVPHGVVHRFHNNGLHTVRMLFFHLPGGFDEYLTAIGAPARPGEAPPPFDEATMERVMRLAPDYGLSMPPQDGSAGPP